VSPESDYNDISMKALITNTIRINNKQQSRYQGRKAGG
jgi:hypothetical protein